jgi:hypothetical protein
MYFIDNILKSSENAESAEYPFVGLILINQD